MTYKDGTVAEGTFKNGNLNGQGVMTYPNGTISKGIFRDDVLVTSTGRAIGSTPYSNNSNKKELSEINRNVDNNKVGVGGWLYLLIFNLVISSPLLVFLSLFSTWHDIKPYIIKEAKLSFYMLGFVVPIAIAILGIFVGKILWKIDKEAITATKGYLLLFTPVSVILSNVGYYSSVIPEAKPYIIEGAIQSLIGTVIYSSIWIAYLSYSKRVAYTYPDAKDATIYNVINQLRG